MANHGDPSSSRAHMTRGYSKLRVHPGHKRHQSERNCPHEEELTHTGDSAYHLITLRQAQLTVDKFFHTQLTYAHLRKLARGECGDPG